MRRLSWHAAAPLVAAGLLWAAFHAVGTLYGGWALGLGSTQEPPHAHLVFLAYFQLAAALGVVLLTLAFVRALPGGPRWRGVAERPFLATATAAALLLPLLLRVMVLDGADIADDESVYRFTAQLLLQGRLSAPSHPLKLFFDHAFVVNDGRMYGQYFLGWPALLAPGMLVGAPGLVNPVLSALTVPALYGLTRGATSRPWAQLAVMAFLSSPLLQLLAATQLSHTAALAALTWTAWLGARAVARPGDPARAALLALSFSVAFFVRPLSAVGIGAPFLVAWGVAWLRRGGGAASLVAFAAPAAVLGTLFLWANAVQTGSPWQAPYAAWVAYARANGYRFSGLDAGETGGAADLAFRGVAMTLRGAGLGLVRLSPALLGWPTSFLLLPLAWRVGGTRLLWISAGLFVALHALVRDAGIDTLGPVHYAELALPILVLSAVGLRVLGVGLGRRLSWARPGAPALLAALVLTSAALYWPVRLKAVYQVGILSNAPGTVIRGAGLHDAVVFSTMPWSAPCNPALVNPPRSFVRWWPVNAPGLDGDVVYANHLSASRDRQLMEHFPGRTGWIAQWTTACTLALVPVSAPEALNVPNGIMLVFPDRVVRYDDAHDPAR